MDETTYHHRSIPLDLAAVAAFALVIARASIQSITIDEADTYLTFVGRMAPSHWSPGANNHPLNSVLMRIFVSVWGVHHLSVRGPVLIGAAVYIEAVRRLCGMPAATRGSGRACARRLQAYRYPDRR